MAKLGFLGLGLMGGPMARNLVKAGHDVALWSKTKGKGEKLAAEAGNGKPVRPRRTLPGTRNAFSSASAIRLCPRR